MEVCVEDWLCLPRRGRIGPKRELGRVRTGMRITAWIDHICTVQMSSVDARTTASASGASNSRRAIVRLSSGHDYTLRVHAGAAFRSDLIEAEMDLM